jgi:hypothetical protein
MTDVSVADWNATQGRADSQRMEAGADAVRSPDTANSSLKMCSSTTAKGQSCRNPLTGVTQLEAGVCFAHLRQHNG